MSYINFGNNAAQQGFQNALSMGLQFGAQAAEAANRRGFNNALMNYDPSSADSWKEVAKYDARTGMALRQETQQRQAAAQEADLTAAFLSGDEAAGEQLARLNFDKWSKIDTRQRAAAAEEAGVMGQAALDVLSLPPEQRQARVMAYAQQMPQYADDISRIAQLPPQELEAALRSQVAQAKLIEKLHSMERPQEFNIGPGEGRYRRDPRTGQISTIVQPNYGGAPAFSPAQPAAPPTQAPKPIPPRPEGMTDAQLIQQARDAIEAGADVNDIFRRLRAWGLRP